MIATQEEREAAALEHLLERLRTARNADFTGYKRAGVMRRTRKRMGMLGIRSFEDYAARLDGDDDESDALIDTILVNVTSFFRDAPTWNVIRETVVPDLVARRGAIRIWSAGCATGEEAFSIAMLFAEALGADRLSSRVEIYATDVDEHALEEARRASYAAKAGEPVPTRLRERYLQRAGDRLSVVPELRRAVIFARHDLVRDPPISHVDLLLCRNTLMYFAPALQHAVLDSFHHALRSDGYLCLGASEMMASRTGRFRTVDLRRRIFAPVIDDL